MDVATTVAWIRAIADAVDAHREHLTALDAALGDGDHGINLQRGFTAAIVTLESGEFATVGDVLIATGTALIANVGGASGRLYGSAFQTMGRALPGSDAAPADIAAALGAGLDGIRRLGGAAPGDKTMVDAYSPAVEAFQESVGDGGAMADAAARAADAAAVGAQATVDLRARKGRASYLGPRSLGHQDPGAASTALVFRALSDALG